MAYVSLVALTPHAYGGRRLQPGQRYEATRQDARLLTGIKRAQYAPADLPPDIAPETPKRRYRRKVVETAPPVDPQVDE